MRMKTKHVPHHKISQMAQKNREIRKSFLPRNLAVHAYTILDPTRTYINTASTVKCCLFSVHTYVLVCVYIPLLQLGGEPFVANLLVLEFPSETEDL